MNIINKFSLLKNIPNILNMSASELSKYEIENGNKKLYISLKMGETRISHFTKKSIYDTLQYINISKKMLSIIYLKDYPLIVTYNKPTKQAVINLNFFGTDDITYIDSKDLYATTVYAFTFYKSIKTGNIKENYAQTIINFLVSVFVRAFGREYGLLGSYSNEIIKIKFLLSCYVLNSFFNIKNPYKKAYSFSGFNYKEIEFELKKIDFSNILNFIDSLSEFNALPGINRYKFSSTFLKFLSLNFLPALEDVSRFISIILVSSLVGSSIIPTHIKYYNKTEFEKIIDISRRLY